MKKNKIKIIFLIIILGITIIILNPRKTLAQLITDDITIGEERYTVNFTTSRKNFPKEIEDYYSDDLENYSYSLLNYKDKNGNDLDLTGEDYINQIEYECFETEICILSTLTDYNQEMFDDLLLRYSSVGNKIEFPIYQFID